MQLSIRALEYPIPLVLQNIKRIDEKIINVFSLILQLALHTNSMHLKSNFFE